MEADWVAQRAALFCLARQHPDWTAADLADTLGRSVSWVKKWRTRLHHASQLDLSLVLSRSHARHTPPPATPQPVVERILALRDEPPAHAAPWCLVPRRSCIFSSTTPLPRP